MKAYDLIQFNELIYDFYKSLSKTQKLFYIHDICMNINENVDVTKIINSYKSDNYLFIITSDKLLLEYTKGKFFTSGIIFFSVDTIDKSLATEGDIKVYNSLQEFGKSLHIFRILDEDRPINLN